MIAFANADGGDLVVGITDGKKEIEGVDGDEKILNDIRRTPFDFCAPSVNAQIEMIPCVDRTGKDNHVLVFHIEPSLRVYANQADEVFLRVGDKSKKLSFDERFQLMNDKGQSCYEETAVFSTKSKRKIHPLRGNRRKDRCGNERHQGYDLRRSCSRTD